MIVYASFFVAVNDECMALFGVDSNCNNAQTNGGVSWEEVAVQVAVAVAVPLAVVAVAVVPE
jgi:hypothetical protein